MKTFATALGIALSALASQAAAHGDAQPMYGGLVQVVADVHYELVPQGGGAAIHVVDHGAPVDAAQLSGKLTVLNGTHKREAALRAVGGSKLEANGLSLAPGAKVIASIRGADGQTATVRFSLR